MTTTKRRTFSQRHYLAVIRGDFKVLWRYAIHGEPTAPQARSLVGMSQSQRKRKARELAFFRVKKSVHQAYAAQAETMQARERGEDVVNPWDRHYLTHPEAYQHARRDYRIGQRLRPCPGCLRCRSCAGCEVLTFEGDICEDCGRETPMATTSCDGSGVIPARPRVNQGSEAR